MPQSELICGGVNQLSLRLSTHVAAYWANFSAVFRHWARARKPIVSPLGRKIKDHLHFSDAVAASSCAWATVLSMNLS